MDDYRSDTYGQRLAADYDEVYTNFAPPPEQVTMLAELARGGTALEIGIGTGRVALPLAQRGVSIVGVDSSAAMLARLADKAQGLPIRGVHADAAEFDLGELRATLAYTVFNTLFMLPDRGRQAACLRRVCAALATDGVLVVEVFVPRPERFDGGGAVRVKTITVDQVALQVSTHDPDLQRVNSQDIRLRDGQPVALFPTQVNYLWPSQLDELATGCGLRLKDRYADWDGSAFTADAAKHVSVYARVLEENG